MNQTHDRSSAKGVQHQRTHWLARRLPRQNKSAYSMGKAGAASAKPIYSRCNACISRSFEVSDGGKSLGTTRRALLRPPFFAGGKVCTSQPAGDMHRAKKQGVKQLQAIPRPGSRCASEGQSRQSSAAHHCHSPSLGRLCISRQRKSGSCDRTSLPSRDLGDGRASLAAAPFALIPLLALRASLIFTMMFCHFMSPLPSCLVMTCVGRALMWEPQHQGRVSRQRAADVQVLDSYILQHKQLHPRSRRTRPEQSCVHIACNKQPAPLVQTALCSAKA